MNAAQTRRKTFPLSKSRRRMQWGIVIGTLIIGLRHILPGEALRGGSFDSFCAVETLLAYLAIRKKPSLA